jgi:tRNA pseudouridine55 synthase
MMQTIHGIILIDKPANISSAQMVSRVKRILKAKKAGHAGTLDPFATGLMICCINRGTRLARFFLDSHKTYEAVLQLGVETDTQDFTGRALASHAVPALTEEEIAAQFETFVGTSQQVPPVYSALKHNGLPLYAYARKGTPIQKPARQIVISEIHLRETTLPLIRFEVSCSAGTYVRTLCADIGKAFGCGGHLKELRRLKSSGFAVEDAVTLEALEKAKDEGDLKRHVIPLEASLKGMALWMVDPFLKENILNGVPLSTQDVPPALSDASGDLIKVIDDHKELLAVLEYKKERQQYDYCCVFN